MTIRKATPEDFDRLLTLGEKMHAESIYSAISFNPERARKELAWCYNNGLVLVADYGLPVGLMMGYVKRPWFSDDLVGYEEVFYISPDHRAGRTAALLVEQWANWCVSHGAKMIRPTTSCGGFSSDRLYEALGFQLVGSTFAKVVA